MTFRTRHFANDIARVAALVVARDARRGRLGRFERHDGRDVRRVESGEVQVEEFGGLTRDVGGKTRAAFRTLRRSGFDLRELAPFAARNMAENGVGNRLRERLAVGVGGLVFRQKRSFIEADKIG